MERYVPTGYTSTAAVRPLLYCCNTWWWEDRFVGVTASSCTGLWMGVSVRWCVHEFVGYYYFIFFLFSRYYAGPALT